MSHSTKNWLVRNYRPNTPGMRSHNRGNVHTASEPLPVVLRSRAVRRRCGCTKRPSFLQTPSGRVAARERVAPRGETSKQRAQLFQIPINPTARAEKAHGWGGAVYSENGGVKKLEQLKAASSSRSTSRTPAASGAGEQVRSRCRTCRRCKCRSGRR